jgi:hypothetical protein
VNEDYEGHAGVLRRTFEGHFFYNLLLINPTKAMKVILFFFREGYITISKGIEQGKKQGGG